MSVWITTAFLGVATGFTYYGCVRLRMFLGPRFHQFAGQWARQLLWLTIFVAVICVANLSLALLRLYLHFANIHEHTVPYEALFAVVSLVTGMGLVFRHVLSGRDKNE